MELKFKEDENGKIHDSDAIFERIDEQLDNEEYDAVISRILSIPREKWSNKLRYKLICAYSDKRDFDSAEEELDEFEPLCETAEDKARCQYMRGYVCYMTDKEIMARAHYNAALQLDPEYAKGIDLEAEIAECSSLIKNDLTALRALFTRAGKELRERCGRNPKKLTITDEQFQMRLGFFPGIRKLPGFEHPIGFETYFMKYEGEDKEKCLQWFDRFYGITDEESFFNYIQNDFGCNITRMANDVTAYLNGKPNFDVAELNETGKFAFDNCVEFVRQFADFIPKAGVLAWDIGEKIGFARHAFYAGIIGNFDYCKGMLTLGDAAIANFSGWEEYMRSLVCGAALYSFNLDNRSISGAVEFTKNMLNFLMNSDLGDVEWKR